MYLGSLISCKLIASNIFATIACVRTLPMDLGFNEVVSDNHCWVKRSSSEVFDLSDPLPAQMAPKRAIYIIRQKFLSHHNWGGKLIFQVQPLGRNLHNALMPLGCYWPPLARRAALLTATQNLLAELGTYSGSKLSRSIHLRVLMLTYDIIDCHAAMHRS